MKYVNYMDLNISQLRIFLSLAKTLSFTRTAEECMVAQPTVSKTIKTLENTLGMRLFTREHGRVALTPEGESLSRDLEGFYALLTTSVVKAAAAGERRPNCMRIAIPDQHFLGERFMSSLREFARCHDDVELSIEGTKDLEVLSCLLDGAYDLVFGFLGFEQYHMPPGLRTRVVASLPMAVYMLEECPLAHLGEVRVEDLTNMSLIAYDATANLGEDMQRFTSEALFGETPFRFGKFIRSDQEAFDNLLRLDEVFISNPLMSGRFLPGVVSRPLVGPTYDLMAAWTDDAKGGALVDWLLQRNAF